MSSNKVNKIKRVKNKGGSRAVKACDTCKRLKTKCVPSPVPGELRCLRCDSFNRHCSFEDLFSDTRNDSPRSVDSNGADGDDEAAGSAANPELLKAFLKNSGSGSSNLNLRYTKMIHNNLLKVLNILENTQRMSIPDDYVSINSKNIETQVNGSGKPVDLEGRGEPAINSSLIDAVTMMTRTDNGPTVDNTEASFHSNELGRTMKRFSKSSSQSDSPLPASSGKPSASSPCFSSPYTLMAQLVPKDNLPLLVRKLHEHDFNEFEKPVVNDVVEMNIINLEEANLLMQNFRDRYGEWCSFSESIATEKLVQNIRAKKCSLLLSVSCTLALRYTDDYHDLKTRCYKNLLLKLRSDLEVSMRYTPQSKEFIQAVVLLAIYANSISSDFLCVDAWYMSSIGIQHFLTKGLADSLVNPYTQALKGFSPLNLRSHLNLMDLVVGGGSKIIEVEHFEENEEFHLLSMHRLWNHLCLSHLNSCVLSGRMNIIDNKRLGLCNLTLELPHSTNFDGRMVAEISIAKIVYNFVQSLEDNTLRNDGPLRDVALELKSWLDSWGFLFTQPITQFVEFNYHYAHCIVYYSWFHRQISLHSFGNISSTIKQIDSSKTFVADYLNQFVPVQKAVKAIPLEQKLFMLDHAQAGLHSMVNCTFDKFKFLSDHLIFATVHLSLLSLTLVDALYGSETGADSRAVSVLEDVKKVNQRFQKIREGELKSFWVEEVDLRIPSVILQYHKAIEGYLQEKFGDLDIQIDPCYH